MAVPMALLYYGLALYAVTFKILFLNKTQSRIWFLDTAIQPTFPTIKETVVTCARPYHKRAMAVSKHKI